MIPSNIKSMIKDPSSKNDFIYLVTRKGRIDEMAPYAPIKEETSLAQILQSWNTFHERIPYDNFDQFYSK